MVYGLSVDSQKNTQVNANHSEGFNDTCAKYTEVEEEFVLEPVERANMKKRVRKQGKKNIKRGKNSKRKLDVDEEKALTGEYINSQLADFTDLLQPKCFAPRTKKAMKLKEMSDCNHLYSRPSYPSLGLELRHLITQNYSVDIPEGPAAGALDTDFSDSDVTQNDTVGADSRDVAGKSSTDATEFMPRGIADIPHDDTTLSDAFQASPQDDTDAPGVLLQVLPTSGALPQNDTDTTKALPQEDSIDAFPYNSNFSEDVPHDSSRGTMSDCISDVDGQPFSDGELTNDEAIVPDFDEEQHYREMRQWTKRTQQVVRFLQKSLSTADEIMFSSLSLNCNRKQAVSRFATCLLLVKEGIITLTQSEPYGDIELQKGPKFLQ